MIDGLKATILRLIEKRVPDNYNDVYSYLNIKLRDVDECLKKGALEELKKEKLIDIPKETVMMSDNRGPYITEKGKKELRRFDNK